MKRSSHAIILLPALVRKIENTTARAGRRRVRAVFAIFWAGLSPIVYKADRAKISPIDSTLYRRGTPPQSCIWQGSDCEWEGTSQNSRIFQSKVSGALFAAITLPKTRKTAVYAFTTIAELSFSKLRWTRTFFTEELQNDTRAVYFWKKCLLIL